VLASCVMRAFNDLMLECSCRPLHQTNCMKAMQAVTPQMRLILTLESVPASETVAAQTQPSQRLVHYLRFLQAIHAATAHVSYVLEHRAQRLATNATAEPAAAGRGKARRASKRGAPGSVDLAAIDAAKSTTKKTCKSANTTD
jgi:hypothetical protein